MPDDKDKQKSDDKDAKQTENDKDGRPERIESNASATKSADDKKEEN